MPEPATLDESSRSLREQVVLACRVLEADGQGDMVWGHASVRDPEGRGLWLKGSHLGFDEVEPTDVVLVDLEGSVLAGTARRHLEYAIHTEIMRARPDVHAVVHTHPLYSLAFAATGWPLRALSHDGSHFVPPDITRFTQTGDLISTPELGAALAESLADRNALLIPHHGIVTVGTDIGEAVTLATHLERSCHLALLAGPHASGSSDEEALTKRKRSHRHLAMAWDYLSRTVERRPGR